jgi:malate/lactate dehydrogenase
VVAAASARRPRSTCSCAWDDLVLVDRREEIVASYAMDLEQALEVGGTGTVRGGDLSEALDADLVVLAAAAPLTVNASRLDYLLSTAQIVEGLLDPIAGSGRWSGTLVVLTNPVDPLCTWIQGRFGIDRFRVLGYTLNDSLRLRTGIAKTLRVDPGGVDAWVLGEHGDACIPLFERVRVAGALGTRRLPNGRRRRSSYARGTSVMWLSTRRRLPTWSARNGGLVRLAMVDLLFSDPLEADVVLGQ